MAHSSMSLFSPMCPTYDRTRTVSAVPVMYLPKYASARKEYSWSLYIEIFQQINVTLGGSNALDGLKAPLLKNVKLIATTHHDSAVFTTPEETRRISHLLNLMKMVKATDNCAPCFSSKEYEADRQKLGMAYINSLILLKELTNADALAKHYYLSNVPDRLTNHHVMQTLQQGDYSEISHLVSQCNQIELEMPDDYSGISQLMATVQRAELPTNFYDSLDADPTTLLLVGNPKEYLEEAALLALHLGELEEAYEFISIAEFDSDMIARIWIDYLKHLAIIAYDKGSPLHSIAKKIGFRAGFASFLSELFSKPTDRNEIILFLKVFFCLTSDKKEVFPNPVLRKNVEKNYFPEVENLQFRSSELTYAALHHVLCLVYASILSPFEQEKEKAIVTLKECSEKKLDLASEVLIEYDLDFAIRLAKLVPEKFPPGKFLRKITSLLPMLYPISTFCNDAHLPHVTSPLLKLVEYIKELPKDEDFDHEGLCLKLVKMLIQTHTETAIEIAEIIHKPEIKLSAIQMVLQFYKMHCLPPSCPDLFQRYETFILDSAVQDAKAMQDFEVERNETLHDIAYCYVLRDQVKEAQRLMELLECKQIEDFSVLIGMKTSKE